ncbi:class II aldolase/adducin family protein [Candidatus Saganbacteria bacterium]|uniref:Class II aldolase/adducin family protein n=1 Tax=Candidatus Saganbacteria bacterium TaxID=2575572 RepID=A0A9D6YW03_UNCSA|nr:class II aldolase/adducin family protein [Candidatus Saganbacteria bacterium]
MLEEFQRIGKYLFQERLVDSHGGNLSLRVEDKIFVTRRDVMLSEIKEGDIIEVGLSPGENDKLVSRELPSHRAIYRETEAKVVVHAHPANAIAVSLTDNKIVPQDAEGLSRFKSAASVRVHQPIGSEEAARLLPSFLQGGNVIAVVKGHGSFAIGKDMEEAYKYTSALENSCRILIAIRASGGGRPPVSKDKIERRPMERRSAIPPGIGVMDRSRYHKR